MPSKTYRHIHRVGIEFEGLWYSMPSGRDYDDKDDGSIEGLYHNDESDECDCQERVDYGSCGCNSPPEDYFVGELASDILRPENVREWVQRCIPDIVNTSCGTHIHMSFLEPRYYGYIADAHDDCLEDIADRIKLVSAHQHEQLIDRLNYGTFCKQKDDIIQQWKSLGDRYTAINFCPYFDERGTVEFRMLPAFDSPEVADKCIHAVLDSVENIITVKRRSRKQVVLQCSLLFSNVPKTAEIINNHTNPYRISRITQNTLDEHSYQRDHEVGGM